MSNQNEPAHTTLTPIESDLPSIDPGQSWGNQNGPMDVVVQYEIITQPNEVCPHCKQAIREKEYYSDDGNKWYHRSCRGEVNRQEHNGVDIANAFAQFFSQGIGESIKYSDTENGILLEALPKSVRERLHRRTRKVSKKEGDRPEPVIKRDADNDPRQTSKGRASLKGSRKKNRDRKMAKPGWHSECVQFIQNDLNKPVAELIEAASKLRRPLTMLRLFEHLKSYPKFNQELVDTAHKVVLSVLEARGYKKSYYGLEGEQSDRDAAELAESKMVKIGKYLSGSWVERSLNDETGIVEYTVNGESHRGSNYTAALTNGRVHAKID